MDEYLSHLRLTSSDRMKCYHHTRLDNDIHNVTDSSFVRQYSNTGEGRWIGDL